MIQSEIICDLLFVVPDHITLSPYIPTVQEIDYVKNIIRILPEMRYSLHSAGLIPTRVLTDATNRTIETV